MVRLVDDLLDVSRISRGKLQLRKSSINVARVIGAAVETMRPLIEKAQHRLVLRIPEQLEQIEADPDRLNQITCNLLHNAIKFTPNGGQIEIQVEQHEQDLELAVTDNGRGIPPEHLQSIFEMFNQGVIEKEQGQSGLGIGLALSRRLAELHGGTIDAHSPGSNLGSTFRLRLPRNGRFTDFETSKPAETLKPISSRRVLVVDDNDDGLRTMTLMLQSLGCQTCTARDGWEALDAAKSFRPDVVFMDLGMPRMNGFDAAERIRKERWGQDVLLIAVTGWGQEKDRLRTQAIGFDDHLVKPVNLELLRSCLERTRAASAITEGIGTIAAARAPERN
jgi:CheY-like chemotaxis protein/two-component sensor histidine kinase